MERGQLTDRQQEVFAFICDCIDAGNAPTVSEIGSHFGISSPNGVMCHLTALESKGYIVREPIKSRGIKLTGPSLHEAVGAMLAAEQPQMCTAKFRAALTEVRKIYERSA